MGISCRTVTSVFGVREINRINNQIHLRDKPNKQSNPSSLAVEKFLKSFLILFVSQVDVFVTEQFNYHLTDRGINQ